jgi:hypothetical protein
MRNLIIFFFLFLSIISFSQTSDYEFYGGLKLNGSDDQIITYRLVFSESKGVIKGYSISDLGGEHETKNSISGTYNKKSTTLIFKEDDIIYTKSKMKKSSFCYVNFNGKVNINANNPKINDDFVGLYLNKSKCIVGKIQVVGIKRIQKLVNKVNNKIQKSKKVDEKTKLKVDPVKVLDTIKMNVLRNSQNLYVYTKDSKVSFEVRDLGVEDGDMINVYVNKKLVLENYIVKNKPKIIEIEIGEGVTSIEVEALNEGEAAPNTADLIIKDSKNELKTLTKLKNGQKTSIFIEKQ